MSQQGEKGGDVLDGEEIFAAARDVALLEQLFKLLQRRVTDAPAVTRENVLQIVEGLINVAASSSKAAADQGHVLDVIGHALALLPKGGR
jgi:hypothetical protein